MNRFRLPTIVAVALSFLVISVLLISSLLSTKHQSQQSPLITIHNGDDTEEIDLIYELQKAEIIPTVLDVFLPTLTINITWMETSVSASYGNTILVNQTHDIPKIRFTSIKADSTSLKRRHEHEHHPQLTLIATDPDAPSRDDPTNSEFCHWIITKVPLESPEHDASPSEAFSVDNSSSDLEEIVPYRPPGPPAKTGKHRYVFVALAPLNGTTEELILRAPEERARWGFERERMGVRKWAEEMGLGVIGANFIYEQNEEQ